MDAPAERRQPARLPESKLMRATEEAILECLLAVPRPFTSRSRAELEVALRGFSDPILAGGERPRIRQLPRNPLWLRLWTRGIIFGLLVLTVRLELSSAGLVDVMGTLLFRPRQYLQPLVIVWYISVYSSMVISAPIAAAMVIDIVHGLYSFTVHGSRVGLCGVLANPDSALDRTAAALVLPALFILGSASVLLWPFGLAGSGLKAAGAFAQPEYGTYATLYDRVIEGCWRILLTAGTCMIGRFLWQDISQPTAVAAPAGNNAAIPQ